MSISASYPNLRPTLLLDFANSGRLDPRVTFTRASTATYFDETGVLQSAAINTPRFDYDPATLAARGFLIEEQRQNLLAWSASFRTQTLAVTAVSGAFTDGETVTATGGGTGTYYAAESTGSSFVIYQGAGAFTGTLTGATSGQTATISSAIGTWAVTSQTLSLVPNIAVAPTGTFVGADWTENTAATTTRLMSQTFTITAGQTVTTSLFVKQKPGAARHFRIQTASAGTNGFAAYFNLTTGTVALQTAALGTGTAVTNSATITPVGNGWYRISASGTVDPAATSVSGIGFMQDTPSGSAAYTGDGTSGLYIWGAQVEVGAFPTSYIPTTTTALTRSADVASVNTLSPWYNAAEGTLYVEASPQASNVATMALADINNGTVNERVGLFKLGTTGNAALIALVSGSVQGSTNSGAWTATGKLAGAYKLDDFASSLNGSAAAIDPTGTIPTVTQLNLGRRGDGGNILTGHLRRFTYYPRRLSNAELVSITA